jgi:hypothetical protein
MSIIIELKLFMQVLWGWDYDVVVQELNVERIINSKLSISSPNSRICTASYEYAINISSKIRKHIHSPMLTPKAA